jgi:hypothetical protein
MIIKTKCGDILFESSFNTLKQTLEYCARKQISLAGANLRRASLVRANIDGLIAPGACFWGSDLSGADLGYADLTGADFRNVNLKECCLAQSRMQSVNFSGAYFAQTLLEGAMLDDAVVSCPSFWNCNLNAVQSFKGLTYTHRGENRIKIRKWPFVIGGDAQRLVLSPDFCLWGTTAFMPGKRAVKIMDELDSFQKILKAQEGKALPNAKKTIPKIANTGAAS